MMNFLLINMFTNKQGNFYDKQILDQIKNLNFNVSSQFNAVSGQLDSISLIEKLLYITMTEIIYMETGSNNISKHLDSIDNKLKSPAFTQSKEQLDIGLKLFEKGLYDKALEKLLKAYSYHDSTFEINYFLGFTYAYGKNEDCDALNLVESIKYFLDAARYAKTEIDVYYNYKKLCASSYFHASNMYYLDGQMEKAFNSINLARKYGSDVPEILYLYSKIALSLNNEKSAFDTLVYLFKNVSLIDFLLYYNTITKDSSFLENNAIYSLMKSLEKTVLKDADNASKFLSGFEEHINRKYYFANESAKKEIIIQAEKIKAQLDIKLNNGDSANICFSLIPYVKLINKFRYRFPKLTNIPLQYYYTSGDKKFYNKNIPMGYMDRNYSKNRVFEYKEEFNSYWIVDNGIYPYLSGRNRHSNDIIKLSGNGSNNEGIFSFNKHRFPINTIDQPFEINIISDSKYIVKDKESGNVIHEEYIDTENSWWSFSLDGMTILENKKIKPGIEICPNYLYIPDILSKIEYERLQEFNDSYNKIVNQ